MTLVTPFEYFIVTNNVSIFKALIVESEWVYNGRSLIQKILLLIIYGFI